MNRLLPALISLLLWVPTSAMAQVPYPAGSVFGIRSEALGEDREYTVALPPSYGWRRDRRYPTLYVLDGQTHFLHAAGTARHLADSGDIPEMIVVAVTSTVRIRDFTQSDWPEAWVGGGGAETFRRFLVDELIPSIDRQFRTDGFRILAGHSASGQFVLHALATEPASFHGYIALAPSLDWDGGLPARELRRRLPQRSGARGFLYFAYADDAGQALEDDRGLVDALTDAAPPCMVWTVRAWPGESHASIALPGLMDGLRELYRGYRFRPEDAPGGVADAEDRFRQISDRLGWPIATPEEVVDSLARQALAEGRFAEAIALLQRNTTANPGSARAFDSLAEAYELAGRRGDAAIAAARSAAIADDPAHPDRAYYAARARELAEAASSPR